MDRINSANAVVINGKRGFSDAVGTNFNAKWCQGIQEELATFIEAQGITLDAEDNTQLAQALAIFVEEKISAAESGESWFAYFPGQTESVDGMTAARRWPRNAMVIQGMHAMSRIASTQDMAVVLYCDGREVERLTIAAGSDGNWVGFAPQPFIPKGSWLSLGLEGGGATDISVRINYRNVTTIEPVPK